MLSRGAVRVEQMIDPQITSFWPEMPIRAARQVAANSSQFVFPVLDEGKRLVGILSKNGFLRPLPRQLILVDHNELSQAVKGRVTIKAGGSSHASIRIVHGMLCEYCMSSRKNPALFRKP
jgi:hypothetical protein